MIGTLLAGALVGFGITLVVAGWRAPAPDLATSIARLDGRAGISPAAGGREPGDSARLRATGWLVHALRLERHRSDLVLTGTTPTRLAAEKVGYAVVGLTFPVLLASILMLAGISLPFAVPVAGSLVLAAVLSVMPEIELRRRATQARSQMRRTVCTYLELVALERAADAGAVEALERAAAIGDGPGFLHIREALLRARLEGRTPWAQLDHLAEELGVDELADVADIMRLSGEDGAAVLPTLRARSASLRTWLLQSDVTAANEASERMSVPVALLGVAFMALLGFPAFSRILFG